MLRLFSEASMNRHLAKYSRAVEYIRHRGPCSRGDIASALHIALPAAGSLVRHLLQRRLLIEDGFQDSSGGRPAAKVRLNASRAFVIGLHISMRTIRAAVLNLEGGIVASQSQPAADAVEQTLNTIRQCTDALLAEISPHKPAAIGIGVSGIIRKAGRVTRDFPDAERWNDLPLADTIENYYGIRPRILNDVHAAALGELRFGACRNVKNFVFLHVRDGIAAGIVIGGALHRGATSNAGGVGHIVLKQNGPLCYCGNRGCLESLASPRALVQACRDAVSRGVRTLVIDEAGDADNVTFDHILRAADRNDRLALNLLTEAGHHVGEIAAVLVNVFDPEVLILGGILAGPTNALTDALERTARARALPLLRQAVKIAPSQLKDAAASLGAGALVLDALFQNPASLLEPDGAQSHS